MIALKLLRLVQCLGFKNVFYLIQARMIVNKIQEVYAACKVFGHDVVRDIQHIYTVPF